jgi:hypothetical protein
MRTFPGTRRAGLSGLLLLALAGLAPAAAADELAGQKKAAAAAWEALEVGPAATLETKNLLLYAPAPLAKRLKAAGTLLERCHDLAGQALAFDAKKPAHPGKVTVFLFAERDQFTAFVRRVEKRRVEAGEAGSFAAAADRLRVACYAPGGKGAWGVEAQAAAQLAALLLARKAGKDTPLPSWLAAGFGRATSYRAAPRDPVVLADRKQARALARRRKAADVWGETLDAKEAGTLQGSLVDFLAYGPASARFAKVVVGFQPEEGAATKTTAQAFAHAGLQGERVDSAWQKWAQK